MPTLSVHRLHFRAGLHLGVRGVNLEESGVSLPSDTLFSALVDGWRRLGGDVDAWLTPFLASPPEPPFLLTSAFPFVGDVRFYPMPVDPARLFAEPQSGKRVKRIRWLSEELFVRALKGEKLDRWAPPEQEKPNAQPADKREPEGLLLQGGRLWLMREPELKRLPDWVRVDPKTRQKRSLHVFPNLEVWQEGRTPRVTVDRTNSASTIFHIGQVRFGPECGLWFGIQWRAPNRTIAGSAQSYQESIEQILALLSEEGIGGDRSVGYGAFTHEPVAAPLTLPDHRPHELAWLLSRYHPADADAVRAMTAATNAAYRIASVAGWLRSPDGPAQRRKRIHLLEEGSLIPMSKNVAGDLVDVAPDYGRNEGSSPDRLPHPVYRAGFAVAAGLAKEANHG